MNADRHGSALHGSGHRVAAVPLAQTSGGLADRRHAHRSITMRCLLALSVLLAAGTRAEGFNFCITTCDGGTACFDETYHYRYQVNTARHHRIHVVIVSAVVCDGIDVDSGAVYHIVNGVHVNAWDIAGVGDDYDQVTRLVLVGDRGDVLILHQTIRLTADGPVVVRTQVQCNNPDSVWPP